MQHIKTSVCIASCLFILSACSTYSVPSDQSSKEDEDAALAAKDYASRLPSHIQTSQKTVLVDPNVHAWGAYGADGNLIRAGVATSGADYCPDIHRHCHSVPGTYHIYSLGSESCKSTRFPIGKGGAPMPYCMFFNGNYALHGSYEVFDGNGSHGCVRMRVADAEWMRFNFATIGTKVVVRSY